MEAKKEEERERAGEKRNRKLKCKYTQMNLSGWVSQAKYADDFRLDEAK